MDQLTYLDKYNALTAPALDELALLLAPGTADAAVSAADVLNTLRTAQDALWDQYRQSAGRMVAP